MAHTNSTSNYELSQFLGTDKPTFLGDYNGDMLKIDAAIKGAADDAGAAVTTANAASALATDAATTATSAASDASAASATATTALNTANNATTTAQNASTTATSAATDAASAVSTANAAMSAATGAATASGTSYDNTVSGLVANTVQSAIDEIVAGGSEYEAIFQRMFGMTSTTVTVTPESGITVASNQLRVAKNTDVSLGKLYGQLNLNFSASTGGYNKVATIAAGFGTRDAAFNVTGYAMNIGGQAQSFSIGLVVETDGTVSIWANVTGAALVYINFPPCLLILQDFGDTPTT